MDEEPRRQPEGSHVRWPRGLGFRDSTDDDAGGDSWAPYYASLHRINPKLIRFPNDEFVDDEAVTLEDMRKQGAI